MRSRSGVWPGLAILVLVASCASDGDVSEPAEELEVGTIVGTIDGAEWRTTAALAIYAGGRLVAAGTGSGNLTFGFGVTAQATATYTTGGNGSASGSLADTNNSVWEAAGPGGSGTITITSFTANEVAGTFSFTLVRTLGSSSPATRTIANGRFRVGY